jgi:CRISPR-associated protein Cas2
MGIGVLSQYRSKGHNDFRNLFHNDWMTLIVFVILVYDVAQKRVAKVLKKCREYLFWVQNSVLEGELTDMRLRQLKWELECIINKEQDSVIVYRFESRKYSSREVMGLDKGGMSMEV